ncbi:MAG: hypothetical protein KAS71_03855 [Bacteroidales bacterium]|nr:hypothetical protein [Bacteroidales bacterium]
MKKQLLTLLSLFIFCEVMLSSEPTIEITNGSFESDSVGENYKWERIDGWRVQSARGAVASFDIVDDTVYEGSQALNIVTKIKFYETTSIYSFSNSFRCVFSE